MHNRLHAIFAAYVILILAIANSSWAWATPSASSAPDDMAPGETFRECAECPQMTVIAPGHFTMTRKSARDGRKDDDPEGVPKTRPAREVTISAAFAIGTFPITRQEFSVFVRETQRSVATGCHVQKQGVWVLELSESWRNPGFAQSEQDPVVCVNWNDAEDYVAWLNQKVSASTREGQTLDRYRLPSWEEIEYAAGAGTKTPYYWGEEPRRDRANYGAEQCLPCRPAAAGADRWLYTSPVGSFPPNVFGLYDMSGNVWQWAQSCEPDPEATPPRICRTQVLHGGSWLTNPEYLRTGAYSTANIHHRNVHIGFRVARMLTASRP